MLGMQDTPKRGRRPKLSTNGERLTRINIKLYPEQIAWLATHEASASATIRELIDRRRGRQLIRGAK